MNGEPIGRERELGLLDGFLERPVDGLRVALLVGEPGIGKSTLWERAAAASHERSHVVLMSRPAETERRLPNLVLGDLFRAVDPSLAASLPVRLIRRSPESSDRPAFLSPGIAAARRATYHARTADGVHSLDESRTHPAPGVRVALSAPNR